MITLYTEDELITFGEKLGQLLPPGSVLTLNGDLGVGKTTLTKGIGRGLGVTKIINSPTFTIVKIYQGRCPLYHFDAYRLEGEDDELGFEEMFEDQGVSVIEWPEFIQDILPTQRINIDIIKNEDESRTLTFSCQGEVYQTILKELDLC